MKKLLTLLLTFTLINCSSPRSYYVPDSELKGEDTKKQYTIKVTEKGLRRLELAITAYKKGTEYQRGYKNTEVILYVTAAVLCGLAGGYWLGKIK